MNNSFTSNLRFYLYGALAFVLFYDYQAWMRDYAPSPTPSTASAPSATPATPNAATPPASDLASRIPQAGTTSPANTTAAEPSAAATQPESGNATASAAAPVVHVHTDVLDADISTQGGTLLRADLLRYPLVKGESTPVRLENDDPHTIYELQSGLTGSPPADYPTHLATYESARSDYRLDGGSELKVPLTWSDHGVTVTKTFTFHRGDYRIGLDYEVHNGGSTPWPVQSYVQILRIDPRTKSSMFNFNAERYAFHGPAMWDGKYRKLDPTDEKDSHLSQDVTNGWLAALQHHFVSAIVPPTGQPWKFGLDVEGAQYLMWARGPEQSVAPGASAQLSTTLFVGPKLQRQLDATSPELWRVADYGRLWFLARPLFWLLDKVHSLTGNWGLAIIIVTFLLKLAFYPLSEASGRSMAKMKTLQPRIKNLQETYKDDREKLGKAMMELYQREKINPVAGCLPIVIQIPVFLAFYWVLLESVEMRQAPFALWIHDLSARDPLFILPALMAVAMFVQYKLNPAPPDPVQAKVFMIMPLVMSVTFAFFPAGLVLYWVTNTVLGIAQQWNINRRITAAVAARRN
jgi:YidC/Oxa1 family membrane protein insertase